ncbi:Efflux pump roqT-like protein 4 [Elsinoe fawcettii]|nr:Efflux pump roqT-like protein 4 [Elsinoe fawcettii]
MKPSRLDTDQPGQPLDAEASQSSSPTGTVNDVEKAKQSQPDGYPHGLQLVIILAGLALGIFLVAIDTLIVSVAIPRIETEFKRLQDIGWYGSAYLLTVTAFQPAMGTLFRLFNIKLVYLACIIIFEAGSILCAAAPNSFTFILGRAIAGVGAAGLMQGGNGTIAYIAPLEKRPLYIGLIVSMFGISACCSPIIGGVLTDSIGWRWCFWINLPIGGVVFFLLLFFLKLAEVDEPMRKLPIKEKLARLDPIGLITLLGGVSCLLIALQWGGSQYPWKSGQIIGLFVGCVVGLGAFIFGQWKLGDNATIPLRILRQRSILWGSLALFLLNWSNNVKLYYLPFYFQAVQLVDAMQSAINFLPVAIPLVVACILAGVLVVKTGHYMPIMIIGGIIAAIGTGFLSTIGLGTPTVKWATFEVLSGFGIGLANNIPFSAVQIILDTEADMFIGNGILTFAGLAGGAIGVQIGQTLFVSAIKREIPKYTTAISPQAVIAAGTLNIRQTAATPAILEAIRRSYAVAVRDTIYLAATAVAVSIPIAACMQWLNLKKISAERKKTAEEAALAANQSTLVDEKTQSEDSPARRNEKYSFDNGSASKHHSSADTATELPQVSVPDPARVVGSRRPRPNSGASWLRPNSQANRASSVYSQAGPWSQAGFRGSLPMMSPMEDLMTYFNRDDMFKDRA